MPSWDATVKDTYKTYVDDFTDVNANAVGDALNDIIPTTGTVGAARVGTDVTKFNFSGDQNLGSLLNNTLKRVRFKFKSAELSGALVSPASDAHMIRLISGSLLLAYCASNKNIQCIRNDTENVNILPAGWAITHPNGTTMIYSDGNNFNPFLLELSLNNILCFHTNLDKHGDNTILCTKSLNNGGAWASSVVVVTASTPAPMLPRAILLPSGDIICFFSQEGDISYTKSSDSGATWGAPVLVVNPGPGATVNFYTVLYGENNIILGYSSIVNSIAGSYYNITLSFRTSSDEGSTWSGVFSTRGLQVYNEDNYKMGYPFLMYLKNNSFVLFFAKYVGSVAKACVSVFNDVTLIWEYEQELSTILTQEVFELVPCRDRYDNIICAYANLSKELSIMSGTCFSLIA